MILKNQTNFKYSLQALLIFLVTIFSVTGMKSARADGGPPMVTDDPGTPGDARFEINLATLINHATNSSLYQLPLLDINYGVGDRLQLKIESPFDVLSDSGHRSTDMSNVLVGVKWRFWDDGEDGLKVSIYPQVEFKPLTPQSIDKGIADPGTNVYLPMEFQKGFGEWDITADLGRWHRIAELDSTWSSGIVLGHKLHEEDQLMIEVHTERADHSHVSETLVNIGTHLELSPRLTLLLSAGRDLTNDLSPFSRFFCYIGAQIHLSVKAL